MEKLYCEYNKMLGSCVLNFDYNSDAFKHYFEGDTKNSFYPWTINVIRNKSLMHFFKHILHMNEVP